MTAAGATRSQDPVEPIPLTVLTGFLGAGKTSLLSRLVTDPALAETAVIINEFGEIGLDHLLVRPISDGVVLLQSGCLCCTLRGDLVDALEQLLRDLDNGRAVFRRVILETTGLADPAPVLQTAMAHPYLVMRYRLDGVITVVDAVNGATTLDEHMESVKQVAVADRIVLTKTDLLDTQERRRGCEALRGRLRGLNPAAPILDVAADEATPERLLDCGLFDPARKIPDVGAWLAAEAYAAASSQDIDRPPPPPPPPRRRESPRRSHPRLHACRRRRHSGRHVRHVPRAPALAARPQPAAPQGHREARGDAREPDGDSRRAAHFAPGGAASGLARC